LMACLNIIWQRCCVKRCYAFDYQKTVSQREVFDTLTMS
jgi:hypothetical protein